jgi:uncharacterized damage-inducible protein DinB
MLVPMSDSPSISQEPAGDGHLPQRQFGWNDMFVPPDADPREDPDQPVGERAVLARFLRDQRLTLQLKCAGLDAGGMARRSVEPSDLSLLGLVRHMTRVEHNWFRRVLAGQDLPKLFPDGTDFSAAWPDPALVEQAWAGWRAEVAFAEQLTAQAPDLEVSGRYTWSDGEGTITLREVLVHMVEEYARHNGHADFLRERIDGKVGQ